MTKLTGKCLCGSVEFTTPMPDHVDACHSSMCQNWTGGPFIGADYRSGGVEITKGDTLQWYKSSDWAKRGFCNKCGTSLFYCLKDNDEFWAIAAGTLNIPSGQSLSKEIFIDEKPDYYALSGEHPRLTGQQVWAQLQAGKDNE